MQSSTIKRGKTMRFKCTDRLGNVAYVYQHGNVWRCTLANGTPAAFSYAVGPCDEMGLKFALEDAISDQHRLSILKQAAGRYAIVTVT